MRHRPKRENYPRGVYGEIDYQERLERYCTYLENKNKALTEQCNIANVVGRSEQLKCEECGSTEITKCTISHAACKNCKNYFRIL